MPSYASTTHLRPAPPAAVPADPLASAIGPPPGETPSERAERTRAEQAAKKRSDEIDKSLKEDASRKRRETAGEQKMLLLGQASSGKTTILKQMRLLYDPVTHRRERRSWRLVVYLNVIVAVSVLMDVYEELANSPRPLTSSSEANHEFGSRGGGGSVRSGEKGASGGRSSPDAGGVLSAATSASNRAATAAQMRARLTPLLELEAKLRQQLGVFEEAAPIGDGRAVSSAARGGGEGQPRRKGQATPVLMRAGWQDRLLGRTARPSTSGDGASVSTSRSAASRLRRLTVSTKRRSAGGTAPPAADAGADEVPGASLDTAERDSREEEVAKALAAHLDAVQAMWRERRLRRSSKIEQRADGCSYFLDNIERIAAAAYLPSDDDILHSRVRTVGITEQRFVIDRSTTYLVCDVGGSRAQRAVWASYFDDARAIIFLAPISAFDQTLDEDPRVNRVQDSLDLWQDVVASPLLARVSLALFLQKMDVLDKKLAAGVRVRRFFPDYTDENSLEHVWRYFRRRFLAVLEKHRAVAPSRPCYVHTTTATSTKQISAILVSVQDAILRENLKATGMTL